MSTTLQQRTPPSSKKIAALRINSFAASVLLMLVFGFGSTVNQYAKLPKMDHGTSMFAAFDAAITVGPVNLAIHAVLGTLLVLTGIATVVRASSTHHPLPITLAGIALLALLMAWTSGAGFVGSQSNSASLSMAMAIATAIAALSYTTILFTSPAIKPSQPPTP